MQVDACCLCRVFSPFVDRSGIKDGCLTSCDKRMGGLYIAFVRNNRREAGAISISYNSILVVLSAVQILATIIVPIIILAIVERRRTKGK